MRKATVFTIIFVFLTLTFAHGANAANCTVRNGTVEELYVVYATWMEADGDLPTGFRLNGWYTIEPGGSKTFSAEYDIYVRVVQKHTVVKPSGTSQREAYAFSIDTSRKSFTTVETTTGEIVYSSVKRENLSNVGGFYEFTKDGTFEVEGRFQEWEEAGEIHRKKRLIVDLDAKTCDAPDIQVKPLLSGSFSQSGTVKAVTRKIGMGLWTRKDTVSFKDDGNTGPLIFTVTFLPDSKDPNWKPGDPNFNTEFKRSFVQRIVPSWSEYGRTRFANFRFEFVEFGSVDADLRISFVPALAKDKKTGERVWVWLADSFVGTDNKNVGDINENIPKHKRIPKQSTKTMTLGCPDWMHMDHDEKRRVVLHEFGHALGFAHEHQNKNAPIQWNEKGVLDYYAAKSGWSEGRTKRNILKPLSEDLYNFSEFDPESIMLYAISPKRKIGNVEYILAFNDVAGQYNTDLSKEDRAAINRMYPPGGPTGTISGGNGITTKKIPFSVSGEGKLFSGWGDWKKEYKLPSGKIFEVQPYVTSSDEGRITQWACDNLDAPTKVTIRGRIDRGYFDYGEVHGYIYVEYIPK